MKHAPDDYRAALAGRAHRFRGQGVLVVEGPDRLAFLQGQLTQDVRTLAPGQSLPAAGLTPKGKLIYWGRVLNEGDRLLLLVPAGIVSPVAAHLSKYAVFQKVGIRDETAPQAVLGLYGPDAVSTPLPGEARALPPDGEFAAQLLGPRAVLESLARDLASGGSRVVSDETAEILRVEAGRPRWGKDADETNLPDELCLAAAISKTKGCYVGQEVVARLRTYGRVNRRLTGFRFPQAAVPEGTIFPNPEKPDHALARVTSAVSSPRFGAIGLGFAFRDIEDGASLAAPDAPERVALVARLPFAFAFAPASTSDPAAS